MWLPLVQTLACLSLINGGLYALHLNGNSNSGSSSSSLANTATSSSSSHHNNNNKLEHSLHPPGGGSSLTANQQQQQHLQHLPSHALDAANSRYGEQLADMAQLERERLMLLGLAKQTAAAGAAATGHHGRPIVTGRIQMTPAEDAEESLASSGSDYPSLFMQQARGFMFGNVVKQPKHLPAADYESAEYEDADALPRRYEYGRVVQPPPLLEPQQQHHQKQQQLQQPFEPRRHDSTFDWQVLDAEPDVEDIIPDLDSYQYLDELLAEQQLQDDGGWHHWPQQHEPQPFYHGTSRMQQNPYHSLDELEANPPAALQELFEQTERQQHVGGGGSSSSTNNSNKQQKPHYKQSTRMQQKWQRKRAQQQFLNHQKLQQHFKQQHQEHLQQQQQRFGMQHNNKLPLASQLNGDESVTKSQQQQQQQQQKQHSSAISSSSNVKPADQAAPSSANAAISASANAANNNQNKLNQLKQQDQQHQQQQPQQQEHLLHPNHKRSGLGAGNVGANGYSPQPLPPVTHSIASQLMLRTARGQRQYDVPQIECPTAMDGMERFACPTPDLQGRYRCIDDHVLCDGFIDCPEGEDEDRRSCMFYKTTKAHLDVLADALLRWARGR